jgi:hypothetical protein
VNLLGEKLLNAIDAAISGPPTDPHALAKRLASKRNFQIQPDEMVLLKEAEAIVHHCDRASDATNSIAEAADFRRTLADYQASLERGQTPLPLETRSQHEARYLLQCEYTSKARDAAVIRLRAIGAPIAERFAAELEEEASKLEEAEKKLHETYGSDHVAGALVHKLQAEATKARNAAKSGRTIATLFPFLH